jgi:hypothetical protein
MISAVVAQRVAALMPPPSPFDDPTSRLRIHHAEAAGLFCVMVTIASDMILPSPTSGSRSPTYHVSDEL